MRIPLCALLLASFLPGPAAAQEAPNFESVGTVEGVCETLVVAGRDRSAECRAAVAVLGYRTGRTSFAFSGRDMMVSFSGVRREFSGNHGELTLDAVTIASHADGGKVATDASPARGKCKFSARRAVRPYVSCSATTRAGEFRAELTSDGNPPDMRSF